MENIIYSPNSLLFDKLNKICLNSNFYFFYNSLIKIILNLNLFINFYYITFNMNIKNLF